MSWYTLEDHKSLGQQHPGVARLADLHAARQEHLSQFWTPTHIAKLMFEIANQAIGPALERRPGACVAVLDNSIGSGRLVQFCNPNQHDIYGADVHAPSVQALSANLTAAGFHFDLVVAGIEEVTVTNVGVALINPPFSITLSSPHMQPYESCSYGKFGPSTSATSHFYAVDQALDAADVVVALLPRPAIDEILATRPDLAPRIRGRIDLPSNAFHEEGADVATGLLVFGNERPTQPLITTRLSNLDHDALPDFNLRCANTFEARPSLRRSYVDESQPSILTPVTGDPSVRIVRSRKRLRLHFACGLTEAKVLNAIHRNPVPHRRNHLDKRLPKGVWSEGQGQLDLELHLIQPDPRASLQALYDLITAVGGRPLPCPQLVAYVEKRLRRLAIHNTPLQHTIYVPAGEGTLPNAPFAALPKKDTFLVEGVWGAPLLKAGNPVQVTPAPEPSKFVIALRGHTTTLSKEQLFDRFTVPAASNDPHWQRIYAGRAAAFPDIARGLRARAHRIGLQQRHWEFQLDDVIECSMTRGGLTYSAQMGLGKARWAVSMVQLSEGRHHLLVLEAGLIDEFIIELQTLGVSPDLWQTIESPSQARQLKKINLISLTRLRMPIAPGAGRRTYASLLRRRISVLVADEGHAIANDQSDQVRALYQVSPKSRYAASGTPVSNAPRSLLPLVMWTSGDGHGAQPYGRFRPYLDPALIRTMKIAERGVDRFADKHCQIVWSTPEFDDSLQSGGKREIPCLANFTEYRDFASRHILRRVWKEPDVARYVSVPDPIKNTVEIDWDPQHLAHHYSVAIEFANWYRKVRADSLTNGTKLNLITILARIGAVFQAANNPDQCEGPFGAYHPLTSKHKACLDLAQQRTSEGHHTLVYATSPRTLNRLHDEAQRRGIRSAVYTGLQNRKQRKKAITAFRNKQIDVLFISYGVGQSGLNLPTASAMILYNRCWTHRAELQALYRALRPQQKARLQVDYLHLPGSLDPYMARMSDLKADSMSCGIDWTEQEFTADDFQHWLTVLEQFVEDLAKHEGKTGTQMREQLRLAA